MNALRPTELGQDASWEASVSAWVDGEAPLRADELDTPYGRQLWDTYHLIGDVLRSDELAFHPSERFYARVSAAIDAEPVVLAPLAHTRRGMVRLGLSGLAVAAAVASVVWVARPALFGADTVIPDSAQVLAQAGEDPALGDYMAAHRAMVGVGPVHQVSFDKPESR